MTLPSHRTERPPRGGASFLSRLARLAGAPLSRCGFQICRLCGDGRDLKNRRTPTVVARRFGRFFSAPGLFGAYFHIAPRQSCRSRPRSCPAGTAPRPFAYRRKNAFFQLPDCSALKIRLTEQRRLVYNYTATRYSAKAPKNFAPGVNQCLSTRQ